MGTIIKFPEEGRVVRFGTHAGAEESATVIILPVIRIERHCASVAEERAPRASPPSGGRRRRPMTRS
jgi:hypothetical protein